MPDPVESGDAAIEYVAGSPPDLILMDIRLRGGMDGVETARKIKNRFNIPVIFLTAHSDKKTNAEVHEIDGAGFIEKPFVDNNVLKTIANVLAG